MITTGDTYSSDSTGLFRLQIAKPETNLIILTKKEALGEGLIPL